ncbi:C40 family peptidase [Streptomyces tsukubensis]|uniref:Glycoside hydrolase n=1 Tax=Streptomyces tsukubensis TaxID=83656 RepID=A0A1V4A3V3_9ACTN|nr:C40 family peptidase [Streptomyces tsukubensis]OON74162.1 glycoside hydrolase [Streptomyces tsukubensis]QFR95319.1 glycoside hydrolase [Streptomyces tsukubensis]
MASHRKQRTRAGIRAYPVVGITTAALSCVVLLSQSANAAPSAPKPSVEEVQKKVDSLYHQAGVATQKYNAARESTAAQRETADDLLDEVAERTEKLNAARHKLGGYAAAQYRSNTSGGLSDAATLLLADDPQGYFEHTHVMSRLTERQQKTVDAYEAERSSARKKRAEAEKSLKSLTDAQADLKSSKQDVQDKLSEARGLLEKLTAEEKKRLAALEKKKQEAAERKAEESRKKQAAEEKKRAEEKKGTGAGTDTGSGSGTGSGSSTGGGGGTSAGSTAGYSAKAKKVIAFARSQIGKPYVWGASGPGSYDCSGLTQAAWKTAGVDLPRTTWDQVEVGQRVSIDNAVPGDLVFFYDDISHVGIYIGGGQMIHAPKPGANVRVESIYYMPLYGVARPA